MNESVQFTGFGPDALKFLTALGFHQDRDWFHDNKQLYETQVKGPLGLFVETASNEYKKAGLPFHGSRKSSLFRINRDVRFSKNKDPYNTHVSGVLSTNGTKKSSNGVYFHFTPGNCLFASGLWRADGKQIKTVRDMIIDRSEEFLKLEKKLAANGLTFGTETNLKRPAPGFKHISDPEILRLLHHRSFVVERKISDETIFTADLITEFVKFGQQVIEMTLFFERALGPLQKENDQV